MNDGLNFFIKALLMKYLHLKKGSTAESHKNTGATKQKFFLRNTFILLYHLSEYYRLLKVSVSIRDTFQPLSYTEHLPSIQ